MKKIILLSLVAILPFSLVACGDVENPDGSQIQNPDQNPEETDSPIEQQYCEIKEFLSRYNSYYISNPAGLYDYEANVILNDREAISFAYNWLLSHRDYKDSAAHLTNFVTVEGALTKITRETVDAFGQTSESAYSTYSYDANGECFELSELYAFFERVGVSGLTKEHIKEFRYDDEGKIVGIDLYASSVGIGINKEIIGTRITLEYDENGNLIKADFLKNDGKAWSNTFTYNGSNQLLTADYGGFLRLNLVLSFYDNYNVEYQYDEYGRLARLIERNSRENTIIYESEYTYGEDGKIFEIKTHSIITGGAVDSQQTYTYDEKGRISCIDEINLSTGLSCQLIYHYAELLVIYKGN